MTHTLTLELRRPLMTANDQRRAHWTGVRSAKAETAMLVRSAARRSSLPRFQGPVVVQVTWWAPDARRRDPDSLGPTLKAALDALVPHWLPDDNSEWVHDTSTRVRIDRSHPRIDITIQEAP